MPNHVHAIVVVPGSNAAGSERSGALALELAGAGRATRAPLRSGRVGLGSVVARLKAIVTNRAHKELGLPDRIWQRNYYERIVRNERELAALREYIANNPINWELDDLR